MIIFAIFAIGICIGASVIGSCALLISMLVAAAFFCTGILSVSVFVASSAAQPAAS